MRRLALAVVAAALAGGAGTAGAAQVKHHGAPKPLSMVKDWTGWYAGGHVGGMRGTSSFSDPFGNSIYGDDVVSTGFVGGLQLGYNWQVPNTRWVLGAEASASLMEADGTNTCLAYSGYFVSSNCRVEPNAFGTFTGRVGYAAGPADRTLLYLKGGAAWMHQRGSIHVNNLYYGYQPQPPATSLDGTRWGWTIGAGLEQALTPAWSLSLEYDYLSFPGASYAVPGPSVYYNGAPPPALISGGTTRMSANYNMVLLGLNYQFGADPSARWAAPDDSAPAAWTPPPGWSFEGGLRYWYSSGKFQWDNAQQYGRPQILQSRLTYQGLTAQSGELYGRIDTPYRVFLKGNAGLGSITDGHINDEDWGIFGFISYSNTLSPWENGHLNYETVDLGYDFLQGPGYKLGAFVGYNHYEQKMNTHGCLQIASPLFPCLTPGQNGVQVGSQNTYWNSLRVGVSAEAMLTPRLRLVGDFAYLPYTSFTGRDDHLLRSVPTWFDQKGTGQGVQVEAELSYDVTKNFNIGIGGRYWAMWTTNGSFTCTGCGGAGVTSGPDSGKYSTERYGGFLEASYKFGG